MRYAAAIMIACILLCSGELGAQGIPPLKRVVYPTDWNPPVPPRAASPKLRTEQERYQLAYAQAVEQGRPLVVFIGCQGPELGSDMVVVRVNDLAGFTGPCIVVSRPRDGHLWWVATLSGNASADDVRRSLMPAVQAAPSPPVQSYFPVQESGFYQSNYRQSFGGSRGGYCPGGT